MVWGASLPQTSVPPDLLKNTATKVGVACSGRGLLGHLSVDFVTFINPKTVRENMKKIQNLFSLFSWSRNCGQLTLTLDTATTWLFYGC